MAPLDWRPFADRAERLGAPVVTLTREGFPLPVRARSVRRTAEGFHVVLPVGIEPAVGPVCLTFHHVDDDTPLRSGERRPPRRRPAGRRRPHRRGRAGRERLERRGQPGPPGARLGSAGCSPQGAPRRGGRSPQPTGTDRPADLLTRRGGDLGPRTSGRGPTSAWAMSFPVSRRLSPRDDLLTDIPDIGRDSSSRAELLTPPRAQHRNPPRTIHGDPAHARCCLRKAMRLAGSRWSRGPS